MSITDIFPVNGYFLPPRAVGEVHIKRVSSLSLEISAGNDGHLNGFNTRSDVFNLRFSCGVGIDNPITSADGISGYTRVIQIGGGSL